MRTLKKWLALCLISVLMLSVSGCKAEMWSEPTETESIPLPTVRETEAAETLPVETTENTFPEDTTAPSPDVPEVPEPITLKLEPARIEDVADDGVTVYSFRYQTVELTIEGNPKAAQSIASHMDAVIALTKEKSENARAWARENYTATADWMAYYTDLTYYPGRMDESVISLYATGQDFNGGSHPNYTMLSASFRTETGEELRILDILQSEDSLQGLRALVLEQLSEERDRLQLNEDYEQTVSERFDPVNVVSANWYLTSSGLVYYFAPYEIAPYRSGVIEVELPYERLEGLLLDTFLPRTAEITSHTLHGALAEDASEEFDHTYTVTVDDEGSLIYIYGLDGVRQLQVCSGYWGINDNQFHITAALFTAHDLTGQDCVAIRAFIPDTLPNISITADGQTVYLSQSGEDGSILLLREGSF